MNTEQGPRSTPASRLLSARSAGAPPLRTPPPPPVAPPRPSAPPQPSGPPRPFAPPPPTNAPHALRLAARNRALRALASRLPVRLTGAVVCLVLGAGLLGGSAAGTWLSGGEDRARAEESAWAEGRDLWRELPVDELFPPELTSGDAGPGGADRRWLRLGVAPDGGCADAFDPLLSEVLSAAGCHRLIRATYTDETETTVTTVGLLFTTADPAVTAALAGRFADEGLSGRTDLLPRPFAVPGTPAEGFDDGQRASWSIEVDEGLPVVAWSVTGFADGRAVGTPVPAAEATADGADGVVALAGLGHDSLGVLTRIVEPLREAHAARTGGDA
ncbi:hypothetical protein [Streptomyces profundus]|uniref:hypothetical protein n=1 Tax=Streptomyces profundus TaxID=2867410 RepID=UPI001D168C25|nr:hypothetical protein [Streptomyces sp. MA3_2.13]UED83124.1 hypothetical protein K4G22_02025 [Streptomyces sp. MA3_2.13]